MHGVLKKSKSKSKSKRPTKKPNVWRCVAIRGKLRGMLPATLDQWIAHETLPVHSPETLAAATDSLLRSLGSSLALLGFGEALHGGEDILLLRNRLFKYLVEAHGFRSLVIESSFPKARLVNDYILGRGPAASFEEVRDGGFSHGFGLVDANRELIEWMRAWNQDAAHLEKLHFFGFDIPGGIGGPSSPRQVLHFVFDYLASVDPDLAQKQRKNFETLLGPDARWEDPMAWHDPVKAAELVPAAAALRNAIEDLISELRTRGPEFIAQSGAAPFSDALHDAELTRQFLNFFTALGSGSGYAASLSVRDLLMADHLAFLAGREAARGKVFVFAHNAHLQRGKITLQLGPQSCQWWPAGAHLHARLGARYGVIGSGLVESEANGIAPAEAGTLEARLGAVAGPVRLIPTQGARAISGGEALPKRSASAKNPSYMPFDGESLSGFDALAVLDSSAYTRGARPLR